MLTRRAPVALLTSLFVLIFAAFSCVGSPEEEQDHEAEAIPPDPAGIDTTPTPTATTPTDPAPNLCIYPSSCTTHSQCAGITCGNDCYTPICELGKCKKVLKPSGTACAPGSYPWRVCNGSGSCVIKPAQQNCFTATTNGTQATNCNDYNPCTQDVWENNACKHYFYGIGTACGDPDWDNGMNMHCWSGGSGEQCCPVDPDPVCTQIGVQAECAPGSVCMEGRCFIACDPNNPANYVNPGACQFTQFPTCDSITEGTVTRYVCR